MQDKYTIDDFAKLVGKSKRTITYWISEGKIETIMEGGRRMIVTSPEEFNKVSSLESQVMELEAYVKKLDKEVQQLRTDKATFLVWIKQIKRDIRTLTEEKGR